MEILHRARNNLLLVVSRADARLFLRSHKKGNLDRCADLARRVSAKSQKAVQGQLED